MKRISKPCMGRLGSWVSTLGVMIAVSAAFCADDPAKKPNILDIFGADIGQANIIAAN